MGAGGILAATVVASGAMEPFRFGWPEAKAVALAVVIIGVWAAIRYGRRPAPPSE